MAKRKTRRAPGAGHLFVRTSKAGMENWYAKLYIDGRQVKRKIGEKRAPGGTRGLTRAEAETALRTLAADAQAPVSERVTVQAAGERLVADREALGRKASTVENIESAVRVHLGPFFQGRSLDRIDGSEVEAFVSAKRREGLSTKSVLNYLSILHGLFEFGIRKGWAPANPVKQIEKPERPDPNSDIRFLDDADLEALLAAENDDALGPTLRTLYLTAAMTGLRQGELLGLRWRDIDWTAARVRVRRNWVRGEYGSPKSRRSSRSVPLADRVAGELDRHFKSSSFQGDDDLVFAHPDLSTPLDRSRLLKRFKAALKRAGVREVRFHDLRHTFGTRMAGAGVPMRTLQEWMGHRDIKTTLIYADYAPSEHEAAWVEAAFKSTRESESEQTTTHRVLPGGSSPVSAD
jgi:integrase